MKGEIILANNKYADITKGFCLIMLRDHGLDVSTIVTRTFTISIYYKFSWYKWCTAKKIKKKVDKFDYCMQRKSIKKRFAWSEKEQATTSEKELTRFAYSVIQGDPECKNGKAIINRRTKEIIGYKNKGCTIWNYF